MRQLGWVILLTTIAGCNLLRRQVPVAPPEVANSITIPEWSKESTQTIDGSVLRALAIAAEDFRPSGIEPPKDADELTRCLMRLETFDAWVQRGEKMTFIYFNPRENERCGLEPIQADVSAAYAISDDGVILKRE